MLHGTLGEDSMVKSATRLCQPVMSIPTESSNSTADSLAALSTAFTFGSILLALLAVIVGFAWGKIIAASAKEEAQKAAKERADDWMAQNGPRIIQAHMETLNDAMAGDGNSAAAAAEIGKEA